MAALTEGWYVDGTDLQSFGTVIADRQGWDDTPPLRGDNVTLLGRHGTRWRRKRYDAGKKTITVTVNGVVDGWKIPPTGTAQRALYEKNLDALLRLVAPGNRLLSVQRVYADGSRRVAECEMAPAITPETIGNTAGLVSLEFIIPGSFWRDSDPSTYQIPYRVSGANHQSVEVFSLAGQTAPCSDAVVTVTGPCTGVTITDAVTGSGFSYGALLAGQSLVVNAGAFTATKSGTSVLTALTLYDGQMLEISPAPTDNRGPMLDLTASGKSAGFTVTLTSYRSWLR